MAKITLLEVHLDDSTVSANAPFSGDGSTDERDRPQSDAASGTSKGAVVGALIGLVFLAAVGVMLRKKFAARDDESWRGSEPGDDDAVDH